MQWQKNLDPWRTDVPDGTTYNMTNQIREGAFDLLEVPFSLTNHYKKVLSVRNSYEWMNYATIEQIVIPNNVIAGLKITSRDEANTIYVLHNVDNVEHEIELSRLKDDADGFTIAHDIFTSQIRATITKEVLTLGAYSSVVIEER